MNIAIVGTGYVGLVTGTCFAEMGNDVVCVDIDAQKVQQLQAGDLPIYEPDLDVYFHRNLREHRLHFTTELAEAVAASKVLFLALPTPSDGDGGADLSYVLGVAGQIADLLRQATESAYTVIVNKSTRETVPFKVRARPIRQAQIPPWPSDPEGSGRSEPGS